MSEGLLNSTVIDVVHVAQKLISINSVTPSGKSDLALQGGEQELAYWLSDFFQSLGFEALQQPVEEGRPNLIVKPADFGSKPVVCFQAHMDTVDVEGMTIDPFGGEVKDGFLYGRGACDVKGPMAALIVAYIEWYAHVDRRPFDLVFLATMGEETGTLGARYFAESGFHIDNMIVSEPTSLQPVVGHKGVWRFSLETFGRAAHSSMPEQGENAVDKMVEALAFVREKVQPPFESDPGNTLSVTMVHGGSTVNIIPDYCRADFDARFFHAEKIDHCRSLLESNGYGAQFNEIQNYPAYISRPDSITRKNLELALKNRRIDFEPKQEPWYSDAGPLSNAGIDTVVWGPGDIRDAHTKDEKISVEQLRTAKSVLLEFLAVTEEYYGSQSNP